jgi:hypothetical protein
MMLTVISSNDHAASHNQCGEKKRTQKSHYYEAFLANPSDEFTLNNQ